MNYYKLHVKQRSLTPIAFFKFSIIIEWYAEPLYLSETYFMRQWFVFRLYSTKYKP